MPARAANRRQCTARPSLLPQRAWVVDARPGMAPSAWPGGIGVGEGPAGAAAAARLASGSARE
jgi:hypothetical protein